MSAKRASFAHTMANLKLRNLLLRLSEVESVDLSKESITEEDFKRFVLPALANGRWVRLWLTDNFLTPQCCSALQNNRAGFANLTELYLTNNPTIGDAGIKALSKALLDSNGNAQLKWLNMSNCGITDDGVLALCQALPFCNLQVIWLESNQHIGNAGAIALAQACGGKIETLWLANNAIGDEGMYALCQVWVFAGQDMHLGYQNNPISPAMQQEMHRLYVLKSSRRCKTVMQCSAARVIKRVGRNTQARKLPNELLRFVADTLAPP